MVLVRRCCADHDDLLSEVLAWSCRGPYQKILWRSCLHPSRGPCMILRMCLSEARVAILVKYPHRLPCMLLYRSLSEDRVEILARSSLSGPCMKMLQMSCLRGAWKAAILGCFWEFIVSRSCLILSSSSRSFYDDPAGSWHEDLGRGLWRFLVRRSCKDLGEILYEALAWSFTGPCEKILWRSCRNPLQEVKILKMLCVGACMKVPLGRS